APALLAELAMPHAMLRLLATPMISPVLPSSSCVIVVGPHYHSDSESIHARITYRSVGRYYFYGTTSYIHFLDSGRKSVRRFIQHNGSIQFPRVQYRALDGRSGLGTRPLAHYDGRALQPGPRRTNR